jgi:site-specific DNA-methyltransferase (cytosine-N4-specific)
MKKVSSEQHAFSTAEVARRAGVHRDTLLRWLRRGLVHEPSRNRYGWRTFSEEEARAVVSFANSPSETPTRVVTVREAEPPQYVATLKGIDWDFQDAKTNYLTHRIHPYPAKFIPQIPNALIQELSSVGDTVGDIFCGSGTTLVEALTLKRHAVGIDANPLACLITKSKTTVLEEVDIQTLRALAAKSRAFGESILASSEDGDLFPTERFASSAWRPNYNKLTFWFDAHVIEELAEALQWCQDMQSEAARDLALTSLSSIIVAVSRQDSDTRYVRREKDIPQGETMRRFSRTLEQATLAAVEFTDIAEPRFQRSIIEANLLDTPQIPQLDLVVCSPPYPNAYSYHLYHQSRMVWLGMDQPKFKREEIGSHRKYSSPGKNGATAETFRSEFVSIFQWLARHLKRGGHACFVVGNSTLKGRTYNNADILTEASRAAGFREVMRITRTMQSTRKAFNPVIGKIKQEQILVLQNVGGD